MSENETHNEDPSANSPGVILKRCREYHGISLDEAAEATKIGVNYLLALEADQEGEFASPAYLKGFLRIYSNHLGLNPDDMIRLFERRHAPDGSGAGGQTVRAGTARTGHRRRISWQKLTLPAVLLALLILTSLFINRSPQQPLPPAPPQPVTTAAPPQAVQPQHSSAHPAPAVKKPESRPEPALQAKPDTGAVNQSPAQLPSQEPAKGFVVRLKVTQGGSLGVAIDGAAVQKFDLTSGDVFEWKAEKSIALELSNAGGVSAEVNGKPLNPFGPAGSPIYVVLDATGVTQ